MEKINYRFLNYKHYSKFLEDFNNDKIREDAIVFIQDNLHIWARGKEYVCDGPSKSKIQDNVLTFKNGTDNTIMSISSADGSITFTDSDGRTLSSTFALDDNFRQQISILRDLINNNWNNLATVAKTGLYSDLINKPEPLVVDSALNNSSTNPVQNKIIYRALSSKVDNDVLDLYVQKTSYNQMVTLTTQQYQLLVDNNLVDESTYYFTYEGEETTDWTFGNTFPVILTEDDCIGTFPITLTEDNCIGIFPITLK